MEVGQINALVAEIFAMITGLQHLPGAVETFLFFVQAYTKNFEQPDPKWI